MYLQLEEETCRVYSYQLIENVSSRKDNDVLPVVSLRDIVIRRLEEGE